MRCPYLWERDRAVRRKESVPRTFHTSLPFPMCFSNWACLVLTAKPWLTDSQQTSVPAAAVCRIDTESPSDGSWYAGSCTAALGGSFTPLIGDGTPEKNPSFISPASPAQGCGWWGLTEQYQRLKTDCQFSDETIMDHQKMGRSLWNYHCNLYITTFANFMLARHFTILVGHH